MRKLGNMITARRVVALVLLAVFALALVGCGGTRIENGVVPLAPRPAYGSLNLTLEGSASASVGGTRQLFLDYGNTQFPKTYPIVVGNHQDNQSVVLWRYDFTEPSAKDAAAALYATLLVRVDNGSAGYVSFFGRAGSWPVGTHILNPRDAFLGDTPETPQNKVSTAAFLFVRQGAPCRIPDPTAVGRVQGYRTLSEKTTVSMTIPGLDFPVGGVTLSTKEDSGSTAATSVVGNVEAVTEIPLDDKGVPMDRIITPIQTVDAERVPTTDRVSPVTAEWDLCFAWQPSSLGVTLTHTFTADPSLVGGLYGSGQFAATGGGFFMTMQPGAPSLADGTNTLNWSVLRSTQDAVWALGWSTDVFATGKVALGLNAGSFDVVAAGQGGVSTQVRAYLSGIMHPSARISMFMGAQDQKYEAGAMVIEGSKVPLVARSKRASLSGQLGQLLVGGRTLWYRQNSAILGADVLNADQTLVDRYGTLANFSLYLPVAPK